MAYHHVASVILPDRSDILFESGMMVYQDMPSEMWYVMLNFMNDYLWFEQFTARDAFEIIVVTEGSHFFQGPVSIERYEPENVLLQGCGQLVEL
ncbi:hypothetical protein [Thalassobacillus sp. CUG 92003]|uniref:hypothetical protein n=1 Tax=Thalassobacillus sp. CUG 92003 TaxID=2736641 RepID=UPI0015E7B5AE|nr:hypothetical protein [Thalassobacillus sp. CUG 92003]